MLFLLFILVAAAGLWRLYSRSGVLSRVSVPATWVVLVIAGVGAWLALPDRLVWQKAVGAIVMPAGLLWIGLACSTLLARTRRSRLAIGGVWLGFTFLANPWVGRFAVATLEAPYLGIQPLAATEPVDALLVLGGGSSLSPTGAPQFGPSGDRIRLAAALYHAGLTSMLVTSGSGIAGLSSYRDLAQETRELWLELKVHDEAILLVPGPRNTSEEIQRYVEVVATNRWSRVGLVTSAWHLRRALRLCARHRLEVVPMPADFVSRPLELSFVHLIPTAGELANTTRAAWEYFGAWVGR